MDNGSNSASAPAAAAAAAFAPLPDPDDGFFLSPDDPNHPTNFTKPNVDKPSKKQGVEQQEPEYILGTLIVRVVAAKNLQVPSHQQGGGGGGGLFGGSSSSSVNPYCSVRFGKSTQRSSEVFGSVDPVWPRQETMFMDVSLPVSKVTHPKVEQPSMDDVDDHDITMTTSASASSNNNNNTSSAVDDPYASYQKPPNTLLTVAVFHAPQIGKNLYNFGMSGDSDDVFLGVASIDLTRLFTGKVGTVDKWLPLQGTAASNHHNDHDRNNAMGMVRIVCEYEQSDVPPKHGDICRFTSYCHPKDLFPLEPGRSYKVEQVLPNDIVLLSYESQEGWVLSFQAHKNMLICEERHVSMLDSAQDELHTIQERLAYSPLVATVTETAEKVVDDGLVGVAEEIAKGSFSLFDRWIKGGLDTVVGDLQHATNFDGRHNPDTNPLDLSSPTAVSASSIPEEQQQQQEQEEDPGPYLIEEDDDNEEEANPYMPPCPITGFPMTEPVVAADGHSYEKAAILRWFQYSDKSPMTGKVLVHKELVPNYGLMSSVQEAAEREKNNSKVAAAATIPAAGLKKPPPGSTPPEEMPSSEGNGETKDDSEETDESLTEKPAATEVALTAAATAADDITDDDQVEEEVSGDENEAPTAEAATAATVSDDAVNDREDEMPIDDDAPPMEPSDHEEDGGNAEPATPDDNVGSSS